MKKESGTETTFLDRADTDAMESDQAECFTLSCILAKLGLPSVRLVV